MVCGNRYKIQSCYYYLEMPANKTWDFFFYLDKICLLLGTHIQKLSSGMYTFYLYNVFAIQQNHYRAIKSSFGLSGLIIIFYIHCSVAQLCLTHDNPMDCRTPGFPVLHCLQSLLKLMSVESVMSSNHLILCHPLLLLPSIFPSIKVFFQWISLSHQVARVLELQLQYQSFQWIFSTDFL